MGWEAPCFWIYLERLLDGKVNEVAERDSEPLREESLAHAARLKDPLLRVRVKEFVGQVRPLA